MRRGGCEVATSGSVGADCGSAGGDGLSAPSHEVLLWLGSIEKGRSLAEARDRPGGKGEGRCHAAMVITGIPSCLALSTRFPVMPLPGNAMTPLGSRFSSSSFLRKGAALPCALPVGTADDLVDAARLGPARGDLLDAGAAAVQQNHVAVLRLRQVERAPDGVRVRDALAAGDGHQCAVGQVRLGLAVLPRAAEVAAVDGGRGELAGLACVRSVARAPDVSGMDAVGFGGHIAQRLERVAPVAEVACACQSGSRARAPSPRCRPGRARGRASPGRCGRRSGRGGRSANAGS